MTVEQLEFRLNEFALSQTPSECSLCCHDLLEAAISYICGKTGNKKPKTLLSLYALCLENRGKSR